MRNIIIALFFGLVGVVNNAQGQFEGKHFVSGNASVQFANYKQDNADIDHAQSYGYSFDIRIGKFNTSTRASGWKLSNYLAGGKSSYQLFDGNKQFIVEKNGITGVGAGIGRFWQFYKHFNEKVGVFAGPEVNLSFSRDKVYTVLAPSGSQLGLEVIKKIELSAGLSAGAYYRLTPKWWITASLAISNPLSLEYSSSTNSIDDQESFKANSFNYRFSPEFYLPSVGLGTQFFIGR